MLLFSPSAGQLVDRMSILELKIKAATARAFDVRNLEIEHMACVESLDKKSKRLTEKEFTEYKVVANKLREQNQWQWDFEAAVRKLASSLSTPPTYEELLNYFNTVSSRDEGNEVRASLVASIDTLFNEVVERKMYR